MRNLFPGKINHSTSETLVVAAICFGISLIAQSAELKGEVIRVADGDTITVLDMSRTQHRIRLQGIDAPERGQPFRNASRKHLASLVAGKTVSVEWYKRDRYGRVVGKVLVDGEDVGLAQIRGGYAWHYRYYQKEQTRKDRKAYARAERKARERRLGLWTQKAIPPWEWRRKNTSSSIDCLDFTACVPSLFGQREQ